MALVRLPQNSFANGVLVEDRLRGRFDLKQYLAGARDLFNVCNHPQGGVYRRPGTIYMDRYTDKGSVFRLADFDYSDDIAYLLVFYNDKIDVWKNDVLVHTITGTGITATQLLQMDFVQRANGFVMVHDTMNPLQLSRGGNDVTWSLMPCDFINLPLFGFSLVTSNPAVTLTPSAISGNVKLTAGGAAFVATDVGGYVTGNGGEARITKFVSTTVVEARVTLNFVDITAIASGNWSLENGYSDAWTVGHGWPRSVAYDNDSLLFGGTKVLPDILWKSAIGNYFDFDDTRATADGALTTNIRSDDINDIRYIISGNDLIIMTSEAEFYVDGELTPDLNFKIRKQEQRGCRQYIKPVFVDGAPMYIDGKADVLRELTYSDVDAKYSSTNLTLFCPGLINNPKSNGLVHQKPAGKRDNDYVWIVNGDGDWVIFNTLRKQDINGFTTGKSRDDDLVTCTDLNGTLYAMFARSINGNTEYYLERFSADVTMDCCKIYSGVPVSTVPDLDHLEGETVKAITNGYIYGFEDVSGGEIELTSSYATVIVGFPFTCRVTTLPPPLNLPDGTAIGQTRRVAAVSLGLSNTGDVTVNGQPVRTRRFGDDVFDAPPPLINGRKRVTLRGGYNRDPVVTIEQIEPLAFHLTDLILEIDV